MLQHEKLEVYQCAMTYLRFVLDTSADVPAAYAALVDEWRRAALSIPLEIAQATAKRDEAERRFATARANAIECGSIMDVVRLLGVVAEEPWTDAKRLLVRVVGLLGDTSA